MLRMKSPRIVSESLIDDQIRKYRRTKLAENHVRVRGISMTGAAGFEWRIAGLIRQSLKEDYAKEDAQH